MYMVEFLRHQDYGGGWVQSSTFPNSFPEWQVPLIQTYIDQQCKHNSYLKYRMRKVS